uniref:Uncharacterized protein n=1 Tax=Rhizophora mucronata TaxID=61149 RepID=A0A2P2NN75_RHIMU
MLLKLGSFAHSLTSCV